MSYSGGLAFFALCVATASLAAAEPAIDPALPPNEAVLAKLAALKANEAVVLGKAAVVGDFNETAKKYDLDRTGPRGRDFTIKMVWAPDRKRALFCGANHGVPHRLNDVWEFDLASLTWVMLYAPDLPRDYGGIGKDYSDVEFRDGQLITRRGGPAIIAHTWWGLAYDPVRRELQFMNTWVTNKQKAVEQLGGDPAQLYAGPPLWSFSPATREWTPPSAAPAFPKAPFGGWLEYVPELGGTMWHANNWQMQGTWKFAAAANAWTKLAVNASSGEFADHSPQPEQVGYYDPQRKRLFAQRLKGTHEFDPQKLEWKKRPALPEDQVPTGHDARSPLYYDPVSGRGILFEFAADALWSYDPDKHAWEKLQPTGDPMPPGKKRLAYVDPEHNVCVVLRDTTVWAYRYRAP